MGSMFSKTKQKSESSRPSAVSRLDPARDAVPYKSYATQPASSYSSTTRTFQVREQTQVQRSVHTSTSLVSSGPLTGSPRYSPVYRRPSLQPNVRLQIEASPPSGGISNSSTIEKYDLSKKAYVLVLHHYEFKNKEHNRSGSMQDMVQIKKVLTDFRTDTLKIHSNLSLKSVQRAMDEVSTKDFSKNSCLIVFIMSHGDTKDTIMAYDGEMYSFQTDVVEKCTMNATLKGKPKIFVIQACRGDAEIQTDATRKTISDKKDIVTFQSTYEGNNGRPL
ncbi:AGAP010829-PA-like protein [Anopheles sinensis]|uniref:AGAP010829-PA-like protein n=1 Tax=Anopheles sinensis TaxID=74873 RepID=A0A084W662_ANOSI|nr:AGAP010829-PA-like protein [Anopheles sinensis]